MNQEDENDYWKVKFVATLCVLAQKRRWTPIDVIFYFCNPVMGHANVITRDFFEGTDGWTGENDVIKYPTQTI